MIEDKDKFGLKYPNAVAAYLLAREFNKRHNEKMREMYDNMSPQERQNNDKFAAVAIIFSLVVFLFIIFAS